MAHEHARSTLRRPPSAWLPAAAEADAYEGIRHGDEAAFRAVAQPLQPVLRRLAGLGGGSSEDAPAAVVRTWGVALRGLDMFTWNSPFATWVARITIAYGRARYARDPRPLAVPAALYAARRPAAGPASCPTADPADWSDLPWSARWMHALPTLAEAYAALPLELREVVHTRDVERWPSGRVCDVLGLTAATYERSLADGRSRLRDALAPLVGASDRDRLRPAQAARAGAAMRVLGWPDDRGTEPLDPRTVAVFYRWRASRRTGWQRLGDRLPGRGHGGVALAFRTARPGALNAAVHRPDGR